MTKYEIEVEDGTRYEVETEEPKIIKPNIPTSQRESQRAGELLAQGRPIAGGLKTLQAGVTGTLEDLIHYPSLAFANQFLANAPRSIMQTGGQEYPTKATSPVGQGLANVTGMAGAVMSPLAKLGTTAAQAPLNLMNLAKLAGAGAIGGAAYSPSENFGDIKQRGQQAAIGGVLAPVGALAIKGGQKAIQGIGNIPKAFRGGLPKAEFNRIRTEYGNSNAGLVDKIKNSLNIKISEAENTYQMVMQNAPEGKQINIRSAIEQAGKRLKRLGLITEKGNLTELGNSEITRDSVYGKLLDFYQSSNAISGVEKLQGIPLTKGQIVKAHKAMRETLVNKDQYTFLRDKLNALYKNKPSDVDVSKVVNQFYADGESSGIKGLQQARRLTREAFLKEERFLNTKTGDLKVTEAKLGKIGSAKTPLSKQELDHIKELEDYIGQPILLEASKINRINKAAERLQKIKKYGTAVVGGAVAGELGRKVVTGHF